MIVEHLVVQTVGLRHAPDEIEIRSRPRAPSAARTRGDRAQVLAGGQVAGRQYMHLLEELFARRARRDRAPPSTSRASDRCARFARHAWPARATRQAATPSSSRRSDGGPRTRRRRQAREMSLWPCWPLRTSGSAARTSDQRAMRSVGLTCTLAILSPSDRLRLGQPERDQLARESGTADRDDDVLLAVERVGHRRARSAAPACRPRRPPARCPCRRRAASRRGVRRAA